MTGTQLRRYLVGRDARTSTAFLAVAVVATALVVAAVAVVGEPAVDRLSTLPGLALLVNVLLGVTCYHAYLNDGLVPSAAVGFLAVFGLRLAGVAAAHAVGAPPTALERSVLTPLGFGLVLGVPLGTAGFVAGVGGRGLAGLYSRRQ